MSEKVSIIIPSLNEEATVGELVHSLTGVANIGEVIVVDDGSTDKTASVAAGAGARVISHRLRRGNGAAVKSGLKNAAFDWVIIMDADGQHQVDGLNRLVEEPADALLVVGARPFRWYRFRDIGNILLSRFASLLSGHKIQDLTSGFRRLHRPTAMTFWHLYPEKYSFPTTSTMLFASSGYPVAFVPIENKARPPHASASKLQPFRQGVRFLTIIYRVALMGYPLRFFAPIGIMLMLMGIGWTVRTLMRTSQVSAGGTLLFLSGLTLLLFGTVADQLAQIRKTISRQ